MSAEQLQGTSPNPAQEAPKGDGSKSSNITAAEATAKLFASYTAKQAEPETKQPDQGKADVAPAEPSEAAAEVAQPTSENSEPTPETAPEEQKPEAQAEEAAPEQAEEGDEVLSQDTSHLTEEERKRLQPVIEKWQKGVDKRIGKEKHKRIQAEAAFQQAIQRIQELETKQPEPVVIAAPTPDNPLADISDVNALRERERLAYATVADAEKFLDHLEDSGEQAITVGDQAYTKATLREIKRKAERDIREHIPGRAQFLQAQAQFKQQAQQLFPEMFDSKSPTYQEALQAKKAYPQLAAIPNADLLIGLALKGAKAVAAEQAAAAKPKDQKPKVAPKPPMQVVNSASVSSPRMSPDAATAQRYEAEKKGVYAKGNLSARDAAELLKRKSLLTSR